MYAFIIHSEWSKLKKNIDRPDFWQFMTEIYGHGARGQGGHGHVSLVNISVIIFNCPSSSITTSVTHVFA